MDRPNRIANIRIGVEATIVPEGRSRGAPRGCPSWKIQTRAPKLAVMREQAHEDGLDRQEDRSERQEQDERRSRATTMATAHGTDAVKLAMKSWRPRREAAGEDLRWPGAGVARTSSTTARPSPSRAARAEDVEPGDVVGDPLVDPGRDAGGLRRALRLGQRDELEVDRRVHPGRRVEDARDLGDVLDRGEVGLVGLELGDPGRVERAIGRDRLVVAAPRPRSGPSRRRGTRPRARGSRSRSAMAAGRRGCRRSRAGCRRTAGRRGSGR